ncbi:ABC transporter ATP-binding protein [Treponema primitia]|uniref:ABC transporter ATP-binding protein n=1 Tax=Treponema primitia TaxID=88058 RepID=UPI0002554EE6|nr:ABC transporter ATP-binding protein [Treponema primitia]
MSALLEVRDISKRFISSDHELNVLKDLSLSIEKGEFVTILGTSGCGKTTLLRCIGGFDALDNGEVLLDGNPVTAPTPAITMVFQTFDQLFPWKTVHQNLSWPLRIKNPHESKTSVKETVNNYLELVNLIRFANYYPHQLSGGMKQRVAIARALSLGSEVILMDEPFASLDEEARTTLQIEVLRLWKKTGVTVLFVTHNIWEAIILGTRIIVLSSPPENVKLDITNPVQHYEGEIRTPSDTGFAESWKMLKKELQREDVIKMDILSVETKA